MTSELSSRHEEKPATTLLLFLSYLSVFIIWGSTYLAIRIGVRDIPPALFAGFRFVLAGGIMITYGLLTGRKITHSPSGVRTHAIVGVFLLAGGNGMVVWSEQWVHSGLAAVIIASVPLFMSTLDAVIPGGHRLSGFGWSGIFVGLSGVVVLVWPTLTGVSDIHPQGIIGLLVASFLWSSGSIYSKRKRTGGDVLMSSSIQMLSGGIFLLLIGLTGGETSGIRFTSDGILALLYLTFFGSIVAFTAYTYLLHHVPPAKAATYAYVNPVVAILLGAMILAEPLEVRTIIATAVILGGVAIVQFSRTRTT